VLTTRALVEFTREFERVLEGRQQDLDRLDAVAGDSDHGATMVMGLRRVLAGVEELPETTDAGVTLRVAARSFASVGGSTGPIWGTALLAAAQTLDSPADGTSGLAHAAQAAARGVASRGRCQEGDKTGLDVMAPVARSLSESASLGRSVVDALMLASQVAEESLEATKDMLPAKGRARRQPDLAMGHVDAGAASAAMLWATAAAFVGSNSATMPDSDLVGPP
jgi:phosphoenolpyruvate---glycerone phosphotransferase subunit DhaL